MQKAHYVSKTTVLAMKITAFLLLVTCLQVSANGLAQTISLSLKNVPLETAFKQIKKQSGYSFIYLKRDLQNTQPVSIEVKQSNIQNVLGILFINQPVTYTISGKHIVLQEKPAVVSPVIKNEKADIDVKGRIVNENDEPVVASILVKGSTKGTTSNADGFFELKDVDENSLLIISGVNIETTQYRLNGKTEVTIIAKNKIAAQEEVTVNAGYYQVRDRERTGSISRVDSRTIEKQPVLNPLQALQGRMAGVYIEQRGGAPGAGFNVQIRGRNSMRTAATNNGNLPLYVVDGVPFTSTSILAGNITSGNLLGGNALSVINPADIESIEVLKDADATAIYGSRGANGVVLITTKKGKAGKTKVDINVYQGAGKVGHFMDLLNTQQYLEMRKEAIANDGYTSFLDDPSFDIYWPELKMWDTTRYTNWQKELIGGTAKTTNAQASVSWGSANTKFLVSGGYYKEGTVYPGDKNFKRGSGSFHLDHQSANEKFGATLSVTYTESNNNLSTGDLTSEAISLSPNAPALYDADGKLNWENDTWINPLALQQRNYKNIVGNFIANTVLSYQVVKGLTLKTSMGYTSMQADETTLNPFTAIVPGNRPTYTASMNKGNSYFKTWIIEPQVNYRRRINEGDLDILLGTTFQNELREGQLVQATGYTSDALLGNILASTGTKVTLANYSQYRYTAIFGRINYNWKQKYLVNLTARRDGSSRFGPGKQFGNFGAAGLGWVFSNENFIQKNIGFLSFGKLRGSYGITGNDAIGDYQFLNTYSATTYPYDGSASLMLTRLNNPDYSWESNKKMEVALELGLLRDRINLSVNWYRNRSSDQLVGLPLPLVTGQSSIQYNLPATVQNTGWEIELGTVNIRSRHFQWSTAFNITLPENKLVAFPDLAKFPAFANRYEIGEPLFIYKAFHYTGVDPQTGLYTFEDVDGNGGPSSGDRVGLNKITQDYYGGLNNSFKYKNLQLDIFIQFVKQTGLDYSLSFGLPGDVYNQPTVVMSRWQKPGDITDIQQFAFIDPAGTVIPQWSGMLSSDKGVVDASFIRLKNVSLSWHLPQKWMQAAKLGDCRLYMQGQNLLTFTDYIGFDPENQNARSLPPLRMIAAGIQLTL